MRKDLIEYWAKIDSRQARGEKIEHKKRFCYLVLKISERKSRSHENKFNINIIPMDDDADVKILSP